MEYFVHAQTVCTRPLLEGGEIGEGPGNEAARSLVPRLSC